MWKRLLTSPRGWSCSRLLPDTPERTQQELTLQMALGAAVGGHQGLAALEVEKAYTRARELCQQLGETPQLFPVLVGTVGVLSDAGGVTDGT